ncbi:MAG: permease prefix domain 1-containing protein [Vicinamibacteraceae bacterium]
MTSAWLEAYLHRLEHELRKRGLLDARIVQEARDHLVDAIEDGLRHGLSIDAAEREAFARFGLPEAVARQCAMDTPRGRRTGGWGSSGGDFSA